MFEGRLVKKIDGSAYANTDFVANNGFMYLFSQVSYLLSNKEIEAVFHPGHARTMLGMLKYTDDFSKAHGLNELWCKDTSAVAGLANNAGFATRQSHIIQKPLTKGRAFSVSVMTLQILYIV
jgi:hypothetical protein